MTKKSIFAEQTKVAPQVSVAEIHKLLAQAGAKAIMTEYEAGEVSGVAFRMNVNGQMISFRLPCRWRELRKLLKITAISYGTLADEKAKRIAWRQLYWWTKAQLAMIQTSMVTLTEVFLPYAQYATGETVFERLNNNGLAALTDQSKASEVSPAKENVIEI